MNNEIIIPLSENYDSLEQISSNRFGIKLGGHKLKICNIDKYINRQTNRESLKICFDLADGDENDGCFERDYNNKERMFTKVFWPVEGTNYLSLNPRYEIYIKKFITTVKKSNPNTRIDDIAGKPFNFTQLIGLYVGGEFGLEEYKKDDNIIARLSLFNFKSINDLPYLKEPQVKLLDGSYISYKTYINNYLDEEKDNYTDLYTEQDYNNNYIENNSVYNNTPIYDNTDLGIEENKYDF